jgi:hypothetical protein
MEYFEELGDLGYFDQDYDIEYSVSIVRKQSFVVDILQILFIEILTHW